MGLLLLALCGSALATQVISTQMSLLGNCATTSRLFQELKPIPALPLDQQRGQGRIVGGEVANDGEFPFQVVPSIINWEAII